MRLLSEPFILLLTMRTEHMPLLVAAMRQSAAISFFFRCFFAVARELQLNISQVCRKVLVTSLQREAPGALSPALSCQKETPSDLYPSILSRVGLMCGCRRQSSSLKLRRVNRLSASLPLRLSASHISSETSQLLLLTDCHFSLLQFLPH